MQTQTNPSSPASRLLAFVLGRKRPHKARPYVPKLFSVRLEKDAVAYLRQQLTIDIGQKEKGQYAGLFTYDQLKEFRDLLPKLEGWVLMSEAQRRLLEEYVYFFWDRAKTGEFFEVASAFDALLDGLHFAKPQKPLFA